MSIKNMLSVLLKEAETYKNQGLLDEARLKYHKALEMILANEQLKNQRALTQIIESKVASLKSDTDTMDLPKFKNQSPLESCEFESIDIISIEIALDAGPGKGQVLEFDVDFQAGNMLSLTIPRKDKPRIAHLKDGILFKNITYYSPIAIFKGAGVVSSCSEINSGPKKGDYCLKIKIVN